MTEVREGELLWTPSPDRIANANLTAFTAWLADERGRRFADYDALWRWSVEDLAGFWGAVWDYFDIDASAQPERVLGRREMPGAQWFPGARLNYAQHVLRRERPGSPALLHASESAALTALPWESFANQVRVLATRLRAMGVRPGDRVASCLPNIPQAVVAMLATTSIGAVWASCSPDFGWRGALDRFRQLTPTVLFCVDGYRFGGKEYDRRAEMRRIADALDTVEHVVQLPYLRPDDHTPIVDGAVEWDTLLDGPPVPADRFEYEQVPFDHPLWILFSSGTTGLPKAIVHGHGGILLEQLKLQSFHMDLHPGDRAFFFTTTGWMMWNFLVSSPLLGVCPVLYDGSPTYPAVDSLWELAQDARVNLFGASPSYVAALDNAGAIPGRAYDLSHLETILPAGAPVSAECTAWFYRNVKPDLWVATGSGGTEFCCGIVGGVPTRPVYAGEIQAPSLGISVHAFDERGKRVVDEEGELVITEPMPSMPLRLWNDDDGSRYRETYFSDFPGLWRHGDLFRVNSRGGSFVLGRSDATLNRHGVRIGTAEIYRAVAMVDEVEDALVAGVDLPGGGYFMPLFVKLSAGVELDKEIEGEIRERLREEYTPRHVPDKIIQVPDIPTTLTGKKLEVPVRKILRGAPPDLAASANAMANPRALDFFVDYAKTTGDYALG